MRRVKIIVSLLLCFTFIFTLNTFAFAETGDIDEVICVPNGDLNGDDLFTTDDVILSLKIANKQLIPTDIQLENGDIDRDGFVTTSDALHILRIISGCENLPEHMYTPWEVSLEPTCTVNGIAKCQCVICYETFRKHIPATGHNYENDVCTNCGEANEVKLAYYKSKELPFGSSASNVKSILGNPSEILTDSNTIVYVYCKDYAELGIFTFVDDELTQFYSNSLSSGVIYADEEFYLSNIYDYSADTVFEEFGTISITAFVDTQNEVGAYAYAFLATAGEKYDFNSTANYKVHEKINFHLLNGCRAIYNVSALSYCNNAANVAYNHSADMAKRNFFAHANPDGLTCRERLTNGGIAWMYCGENIAARIMDPYTANNGWYNSPDHRDNMLDSRFKNAGIGIASSNSAYYKYFATQNFYSN